MVRPIHETPSPALADLCPQYEDLPSPFLQDHDILARRNQFGTFQVKNEQNKTETNTKLQKTKTIKTEQKTTDKLPTAGQRVVHFRAVAYALTMIGVAAACGLSVPAPMVPALHTHCACAHRCASCHYRLSLVLVSGRAASHPPSTHLHASTPLRSPLHAFFSTGAGSRACRRHGQHQPEYHVGDKLDRPISPV